MRAGEVLATYDDAMPVAVIDVGGKGRVLVVGKDGMDLRVLEIGKEGVETRLGAR